MAAEAEEKLRPPDELLSELTAERERQNRIRTVLGSGLFGLLLLFAMAIFVQFRNLDTQRLEVKMNAKASAALWPIVSEQLDRLTPQAIPALDGAMVSESKTLLPLLNAALAEEKLVLAQQMEKQADFILEEAIGEAANSRGLELDGLRSALHTDPTVSELASKALLERAQGWARSELDFLLREQMGLLEALHGDTTRLEQAPLDEEALKDAVMLFIEIAKSQQQAEG